MTEERAKDPNTGGEKGRKPECFGLVPLSAVGEIATVYDYGSRKYAAHNWRKGYPYSWSFDALLRHLTAWWEGEENDPESGLCHLAHAGFHILALLWFKKHGKGTDDRYVREANQPTKDPEGPKVPPPFEVCFPRSMDRASFLEHQVLCTKRLEAYKNSLGYTLCGCGLVYREMKDE